MCCCIELVGMLEQIIFCNALHRHVYGPQKSQAMNGLLIDVNAFIYLSYL